MSDEDLARTLKAIDRVSAEHSASPEKARAFLIKVGIYNEAGELTEPYRSNA